MKQFLIVLFLTFLSISLPSQEIPENTPGIKYIQYENGYFTIAVASERLYILKNFSVTLKPIGIYYTSFDKKQFYQEPTGSYFNINNKVIRYSISVISGNVLKKENSSEYSFRYAEIVKFLIKIDTIEIPVEIEVISLPVGVIDSIDRVIETMGFPDKKQEIYVRWPRNDYYNGIFYETKDGSDINVFHYFFDKYPNLTLSTNWEEKYVLEAAITKNNIETIRAFRRYSEK
jgi:hypothetical protein